VTPLEVIIRDTIAERGPISVADYMQLALQHPELGYYRKGDPLGSSGDFTTAPEISQMFGEMIGLWCAETWRQMGKPTSFILLEMGPGRGTLMQDALRATGKIVGFHDALKLSLMEINRTLREAQQERLGSHRPLYIEDLSELPPLPILAVANEFFDALPIRQFEKMLHGWGERFVGVVNGVLAFTLFPLKDAMLALIPGDLHEAKAGTIVEVSMPSLLIMRDLAAHIVTNGGAGIFVDYGYEVATGKPTLQAVSGHQSVDVLKRPGEVDLTAHVDFAALRRAAMLQQAGGQGPIAQGDFLRAMGIELRAGQLKQRSSPEQAKDIDTALSRLTGASEMGTLFKVMAIMHSSLNDLAGFP